MMTKRPDLVEETLLSDEEARERQFNSPGVKEEIADAMRRAIAARRRSGSGEKDLIQPPGERQ